MSFNKNQKSYNKKVMQTGKEANQYLRNALGLINQYTTNYADRTDYWTNKLSTRQLDLLSDKYLQENANMLRGQAAFGSNSKLNEQMKDNAYSQQNYLANVLNQNVMNANSLQENELRSLMNASNIYQNPISMGASAAQNVDAANSAWANTIGQGLGAVGTAVSFINPAIGGAISAGGNLLSSMATPTTDLASNQYRNQQQQNYITQMMMGNVQGTAGLANAYNNLSTQAGQAINNWSIGNKYKNQGNFDNNLA